MITANIWQRAFQIHYGNGLGTCFAIDVDNKQYLVTAKHVVPNISKTDQIHLLIDEKLSPYESQLVGVTNGDVDIAVLAISNVITPPNLPTSANADGIIFGQDIYILGYPYGWHSDIVLATGSSLPIVRKGCLSGALKLGNQKLPIPAFLLDAHVNSGFSGGPLLFHPGGNVAAPLVIAGVIAAYRIWEEPTFVQGQEVDTIYKANTGLAVAYNIQYAVDIIRSNPIGAQIVATPS